MIHERVPEGRLPEIPSTVNELMIDRHFARDPATRERVFDPILAGLEEAMRATRDGAERARGLTSAVLKNEMMTLAARHRRARDESWRAVRPGMSRIDSARTAAETALYALRAEIASPARRTDPATVMVEGEVRARLAAMQPEERQRAISDALAARDEQVLAAVLNGPAMLSGLADRAEREEIRARWQQRAHPEKLDRIARIERALADVDSAGSLMVGYMAQLTDEAIVSRAEESERAAEAAIAGAKPEPERG